MRTVLYKKDEDNTLKSDKDIINYLLDNYCHIDEWEFVYHSIPLCIYSHFSYPDRIHYDLIDSFTSQSLYTFKEMEKMFASSKNIEFGYEAWWDYIKVCIDRVELFEAENMSSQITLYLK